MQTIFLSGTSYQTAAQVHAALKMLLNLPDYFGKNADALYDCLSERPVPVRLWVSGEGADETAAAMKKIVRVVTDLGGTVKEL